MALFSESGKRSGLAIQLDARLGRAVADNMVIDEALTKILRRS
jgi:hypothetical protein